MAGVSWSWEGLGGAPVAVGHGGGEFEGGVSMGRVLRYVRRYVNLCVCADGPLFTVHPITNLNRAKRGAGPTPQFLRARASWQVRGCICACV